MAGILVETPWLMLPFLFAIFSFSTYLGTTRKLGAALLLIQVVCLDTFLQRRICARRNRMGCGRRIRRQRNRLRHDRSVRQLALARPRRSDPAGIAGRERRARSFAAARGFKFLPGSLETRRDRRFRRRLRIFPRTWLFSNRAVAEGVSEHRHAILLAAITRVARIGLEVDRLIVRRAPERTARDSRRWCGPKFRRRWTRSRRCWTRSPAKCRLTSPLASTSRRPASRTRARSALDALAARVIQLRPAYIGKASSAEIENFAAFTDSLAVLTAHIERLLDEPPQPPAAAPSKSAAPRATGGPDPAVVRFSMKVGLCVVIGYVIGLITQRADLSTILTTVLITALPTYGAALRKMILRIVGAIIGGAVSLLAIIIVTPNFETLPAYMLAVFIVFYYLRLRVSQQRTRFIRRKADRHDLRAGVRRLEPRARRLCAALANLGNFARHLCRRESSLLLLWPEYAGDSLLPRLREVIRDTLALAPGGPGCEH